MKNLGVILVCVMTLISCEGKKENSKSYLKAANDSLTMALMQRDAEMNELMGVFNEIQEGFRQIRNAEDRVDFTRGTIAENVISAREQITADIEFITSAMAENKAQINKLQKMLNQSRGNVAELKKAVERFTRELGEKAKHIEELQVELASKNIRIQELDNAVNLLTADKEALTMENEEKAKVVAEQDKSIHTAWFVFGTKAELKKQKILQKDDVLKNADFNRDYFTRVDIRTQKEINLYSKHAELLTSHPVGSYELVKDNKQLLTLKITDSTAFWSVSKYLVVQVR
ncbi:Chromosome partition protein Smc [termite gut metagenome]|uniref:Chromosome partition protein Smc n=1 Tax=termite gut metagenome TaxID=433724 RepID=A0A5J4SY59_9ZZZZ